MSWTITPSNLLVDDADALAYLTAVETTDGQALESGVRLAVNAFVKGCKADGTWPALKASCILAGARTRLGALTPLVGTAPTSFNFVDGDYDRKTGLVGDGSTKYLNSNRAGNADPQNNHHLAVYATVVDVRTSAGILSYAQNQYSAGWKAIIRSQSETAMQVWSCNNSAPTQYVPNSVGLIGFARNQSASFFGRGGGQTQALSKVSNSPETSNIGIFARANGVEATNGRLAFYSIGTSLDLALLDARVTTLINAIGAAIP